MAWSIQCGWEDVPHIPDEEKTRLLRSIPAYQRDARSRGVPRLGAGAVYPIAQEEYTCQPIDVRSVAPWVMHAYGMDVGWNATAAVRAIRDAGADTVTVVDEYKRGHAEPATHIARITRWGRMMGAIDPASRGRSQKDGSRLFDDYRDGGLLLKKAENAVEAGIYEVYTMLTEGRLKIAENCQMLLQEMSLYHRDDKGKIVKKNDHLVDALRYLVMTPAVFSLLPEHRPGKRISIGQGGMAHV